MIALVKNTVIKRFFSCIFLALVAAVVTDNRAGTPDHPTQGVRESLQTPHALVCLLLGIAVWALWTYSKPLLARVNVAQVSQGTSAIRDVTGKAGTRYSGYLVLLAVAILLPRAMPLYLQQTMFTGVAIYALLALGLNVVVGYAGLLDLGFIAFYAIGAYTTAYLTQSMLGTHVQHPLPTHAPFHLNPFFVLPIAAAVAALAGTILGGPTLRLRGDYLAIVTLGFGEIVQIVANNASNVTGGAQGAFGVPKLSVAVGPAKYAFTLAPLPYYYLLLGIIVLVMIAFRRLERSRTGRAWAAIREDEVAAAASGVRTLKYKLLAFAIGASTSGFAGVIFASSQFFNPLSFGFKQSILVLTIVIFGGMGNIFGSIVGAFVLQFLTAYLTHSNIIPPEDSYIFFGAIVMLMMVFRPQGLIPSRRRSREIKLSEAGIGSADALGSERGPISGGVTA